MNARDHKNKLCLHIPTQTQFICTGGKMLKNGGALLNDEAGNVYSISECEVIEISHELAFDVRKLKAARTIKDLEDFSINRSPERVKAAWAELDKDVVEAASVAILYCTSWKDFCNLAEGYGLSKEQSPELNQEFKERLKEKGLDELVKRLYTAPVLICT